jgi:hypothetical protein
VIQAANGTRYVVQGQRATRPLPDPISHDRLASLNQVGELDGDIPADLLVGPISWFGPPVDWSRCIVSPSKLSGPLDHGIRRR